MASWKKVVVSGSSPEFANITGSGDMKLAGDLIVSGGDITLGSTSIFSGGDTTSLNNIDALDATTEATVEAAIDTFPKVRSSAVIGLPDDDLGNIIHAIVDTDSEEVTEQELLEHLSNHLVRYKIPRTLEFVNEPIRDEAGKVRRTALRDERISLKKLQTRTQSRS